MKWQPIESIENAPKNKAVLVTDGELIWIARRPHHRSTREAATHWMPLPDPPVPAPPRE